VCGCETRAGIIHAARPLPGCSYEFTLTSMQSQSTSYAIRIRCKKYVLLSAIVSEKGADKDHCLQACIIHAIEEIPSGSTSKNQGVRTIQ